jgi:hypothetical protein
MDRYFFSIVQIAKKTYGNKAFVPVNGMDSWTIPEDLEEDMWADVIEQINSGDLDRAIEQAAKQATPDITKR